MNKIIVSEQKSPDEDFKDLLARSSYLNDEKAFEEITKAFEYAKKKHQGQKRVSGEPYILHPIAVASILAELRVDLASIVSALLHDVVEDTDTTIEDIEKEFGKNIAELVDGLTKIGKIKFRSSQERMAENFRKMILAMAKDLRVILVKLSDRLHNMRTLGSLPLVKRLRIAKETLEIYAPLANRLGIYGIKSELEDLCFKESKNEIYKEISQNIAAKKNKRESYINEIKEILENELTKYGFSDFKVYGRPKHFYSIYRKMVSRQLAFKDIHDLFGFRILVESVKDCYEVLGIVHSMWKPMPGRFKDYIAMPKANLYQSLHTTVIRPNGQPAEIQIRTFNMHDVCEYGIAAHWSYKEKTKQLKSDHIERFSWLRQMVELQQELKDPNEFLAAVKVDLFDEEIFVFTPKGDVIQLRVGATILDFAFAIHSDVGLKTLGAKINGRITPLRSEINSGDIVEVITSSTQKPNKDWLNFVTTSKARNKIRSCLRSEQRNASRKIGKDVLAHELTSQGHDLEKLITSRKIDNLVKQAKESSLDELYLSIGYGKLSVKELVQKCFPSSQTKEKKAEIKKSSSKRGGKTSGILVSGMEDILVSFSRCCNPLPGEEIVGFITRGRGVSIHCHNCMRALDLDPARKVDVSWVTDEKEQGLHTVYLQVVTEERQGILADVTMAISNCGVNIRQAQVRVSTSQKGILDFEIVLNNLSQLNQVIRAVELIPDVAFAERKNSSRKK
ncbi:MAG: GTP pyrophosphokinase [Zetaproteobacteria bacterium]|nr:GTP pyrophosphokinase [Pseudobdellovibrionaceae bacterium]